MIAIGKKVPAIEERRNRPKMPPMLAIGVTAEPKAPDDPMGAPDSPAEEGSEDYTGKLIEDITAAGAARGLSPEDSKGFAADLMDALAKCLRGGGEEEESGAAPPSMEADTGEPTA